MARNAGLSASRFSTHRVRFRAGHIDLEAAEDEDEVHGTLGPEAAQWAQSLLEVARFELARADDKANTLFRFYGVVGALSIGLLAATARRRRISMPWRRCCSGPAARRSWRAACTSA
jgi:hypothetical protein